MPRSIRPIEFVFQNLQQATVQQDPPNHEAELKLSVAGTLHMAGVERPITMDVIVRRDSRRHFLAHAQTTMLMSDFGVTPPVALFGLIKRGDQVLVIFDLDLAPGMARSPSGKLRGPSGKLEEGGHRSPPASEAH